MKLFEEMEKMGGDINDVIQKMINDMFHEELDDDDITDIVNRLSLSDLLALDDAYSMNDVDAVQDIIGPLPTMEYSMGGYSASSASNRPAARTAAAPVPAAKKQTTTTQSTSSYSGGGRQTTAGNAPEPELEEEPIDEAVAGWVNREEEKDTWYGIIHYPDTSISYIVRRPHEDWQHIYDPSYGYDGAVSAEDLDIAEPIDMEKMPSRLLQHDIDEAPIDEATSMDGDQFEVGDEVGFKDGYEQSGRLTQINGNDLTISVFDTDTGDRYNVVKSARGCWKESTAPATNIVEMTTWLRRRAGIK